MYSNDSETLFDFLFPYKNGEFNIENDSIDSILKGIFYDKKTEDIDTREKSYYFRVLKTGRKRKNEAEIFTDISHNKYSSDNIMRKIQIHFISFIIKFINLVLEELGYEDKFCNINYSFKEKVNKRNIAKLKSTNIGYILRQKISKKYTKNAETNIIIYEKLKNTPILRNIFSYNYRDFFKDFYYNKESNLNLNKFGININLKHKYGDSIKMYNDLKEKNNKDPEYIKKLDEYVNKF